MPVKGHRLGPTKYGRPPAKGYMAKVSPRQRARFDRIAEIFEREPEILNAQLAGRLGLPLPATVVTLKLMIRHDPARYKRRAHRGKPTRIVMPDGSVIRRRLRVDEVDAQNEMIKAAVEDGVPLQRITQSFPFLTPARLKDRTYLMRKRGELAKDTRVYGKAKRPQSVTQKQMSILARKLLDGVRNAHAIQRALNRVKYQVGNRTIRYPLKSVATVYSMRRALQARLARMLASIESPGKPGRTDFARVRALADFLDIGPMEPFRLAEILKVAYPPRSAK